MFFKKFFVGVLLGLGLSVNAFGLYLSGQDKLSKTEQYLCSKVDTTLCGINQAYIEFNDYHKKILYQKNTNTLNIMDDTLPIDIQNALNDIEGVTNIYNIRNILLTSIKFSKYYNLTTSFAEETLNPLEVKFTGNRIWEDRIEIYMEGVRQYNTIYVDPYRDSVRWRLSEIGRAFADSASQLKASTNAAISVSKATFLYPYVKSIKVASKIINLSNIEVGYKVAVDLIPSLVDILPKFQDGSYTGSEILAIMTQCDDIVATMSGDSSPSVVRIVSVVKALYDISKQNLALQILEENYKDNEFTAYTVSVLRDLVDSKSMIAAADAIKMISDLLPSGSGNVDDFIDVANNLIKAFGDYELRLRRILHKNSLNDQYLKLFMQRVTLNTRLYTSFMYYYFNENASKIINLDTYEFSEKKEEIADTAIKPTINFILPQNATAIYPNLTAPQGKTVSFAPDYSAKRLIKCINDANISGIDNNTYYHTDNADLEWKLGYVDNSTGIHGASILLERDNGNGFSFASPKSSSMRLTDLYYGTPGKRDWHDCPWEEMSWESIVWDVDGGVDGNTSTSATYPLKHTGQTTSYAVGDDAYYHAGKAVHYSRDDNTQIVTDHITGLEWQDDVEAKTVQKNWADAKTYCTNKGNGWRLPIIEELLTIVDYAEHHPLLSPIFQNSASNNYWSSTAYAGNSDYAWNVYSHNGNQNRSHKSNSTYVRCVKAGQ